MLRPSLRPSSSLYTHPRLGRRPAAQRSKENELPAPRLTSAPAVSIGVASPKRASPSPTSQLQARRFAKHSARPTDP